MSSFTVTVGICMLLMATHNASLTTTTDSAPTTTAEASTTTAGASTTTAEATTTCSICHCTTATTFEVPTTTFEVPTTTFEVPTTTTCHCTAPTTFEAYTTTSEVPTTTSEFPTTTSEFPTPATTQDPTSFSQDYLGCFEDTEIRSLPDILTINTTSMTTELCRETCMANYTAGTNFYFGTQNGYACSCGTNYPLYPKVSESDCSVACAGNSSQTCGGPYHWSVYMIYY